MCGRERVGCAMDRATDDNVISPGGDRFGRGDNADALEAVAP